MGPPREGEGPASTGPPDRQTLRLLERVLGDEPVVVGTEFDPDGYEPRLLRVHLDDGRYPAAVTAVRLDVRWFTTGDFSMHYLETGEDGDRWECRWDRHPNSHDDRLHFHRPPDGNVIESLVLPSLHPLDVASTVVAAVEKRIDRRWSKEGG